MTYFRCLTMLYRFLLSGTMKTSAMMCSEYIAPCVPTLRAAPPTGEGWLHEAILGGVRIQVHKKGNTARLYTTGGYDCAHRLPNLSKVLAEIAAHDVILDGELTIEHGQNRPPRRA